MNLSDPQTWNRYVRNNPLVFVDPLGFKGESVCDTLGTRHGNFKPTCIIPKGGGGGGGCDDMDFNCMFGGQGTSDWWMGGPGISYTPPGGPCGTGSPMVPMDPCMDSGGDETGKNPLCVDSQGQSSACYSGPAAPGQPFPVNCVANCSIYPTDPLNPFAQNLFNSLGNDFPAWTGQQYFSSRTCDALIATSTATGIWGLANPEILPAAGTVSALTGLTAWAGCP